jgi:hypothetical protein
VEPRRSLIGLGTGHAFDRDMRRTEPSRPSDRERAIMREVTTRLPHHHLVDVDPEDPTQQLDDLGEFHVEPLDVEARPAAERAEELDLATAETIAGESEPELAMESEAELERPSQDLVPGDTGELYGVRTPHAGGVNLAAPEDRDAFEGAWLGETWLESLEEHAAEMGPVPEEPVVVVDDSDVEHPDHRGHHATERGDPPVADKGSGGPGGL